MSLQPATTCERMHFAKLLFHAFYRGAVVVYSHGFNSVPAAV